ncbi:hypothetical protein ILYODFUR_028865 [Ilyodon furcidens]|uniref:Uncharacterized protein n=1 Tax=Ilyodon furcidens TaxID=33524 RepID=A0ABV0T2S2_9TELE
MFVVYSLKGVETNASPEYGHHLKVPEEAVVFKRKREEYAVKRRCRVRGQPPVCCAEALTSHDGGGPPTLCGKCALVHPGTS